MASSQDHAVVFGASGINGWALVKELLAGYPTGHTFGKVTAIFNRPLSSQDSAWPQSERLQIISGVDLTAVDADLGNTLATNIDGADTISHVYYAAYRQSDNVQEECQINTQMIKAAVTAVESVSKALACVVLITGTKTYGLQMLDKFPYKDRLPLGESLPRIPAEYAKDVFYYHQVDALTAMSQGKKWTWVEVRPDVIVGLAPIGNAHCMAQTMGIYLSLYAFVEGPNAQVPFPGTQGTYTAHAVDSNQDIIARLCIFASLRTEETGQNAYNVGDTQPTSWLARWAILAKYFGLEGVGPSEGSLHPTEYAKKHSRELEDMCSKHELKAQVIQSSLRNPGSRMNTLKYLPFDRQLDLAKSRALGFKEEMTTEQSWYSAFDKLKAAKIIPP